jgi:hypothetical protein
VSWSSFATGTSPGKTEIFDWLRRNPADYLPDFAMISESKRTFLFGESNGAVVGAIAAGAVFVLALLLVLLVRLTWVTRLAIATLAAAASGFPPGSSRGRICRRRSRRRSTTGKARRCGRSPRGRD